VVYGKLCWPDLSPEKYPEEKIIAILKEVEAGAKVAETCRKYGISDATYYNWKTKYADLELSELKRLRALEEENNKLKRIVAEQAISKKTADGPIMERLTELAQKKRRYVIIIFSSSFLD